MPKLSILNIPPELLLIVLSHLGYRDILNCEAVSKYFDKAIKDSVEMQYLIELGADGMVDGARTTGSLPTAERLQLLLNRRARWRTLNWKNTTTLSLDGVCDAYDIVGGVFAKTTGGSTAVLGARHLTAINLPTRDAPAKTTIFEDMGVQSRGFAIDPSQDLLAIVEIDDSKNPKSISIHLRTISTNTPHKMAKIHILQFQKQGQIADISLQIVDDIIGFFLTGYDYHALLIWNWRTGKLVLRREADRADDGVGPQNHPSDFPRLPPATWGFAFLSSRTYLINSIHGKGFIYIYSFDGDSEPDIAPILWATLAMPDIQPNRAVRYFTTNSAPFLGRENISGNPFTTDEDARVYMMCLAYEPERYYLVFMKSEFLKSLIPKQEELMSSQTYVPPVYQWEEWGPVNTRFFWCPHISFNNHIQGHRVVLSSIPPKPLPGSSSISQLVICVLNFKVHPERVDDPCNPYTRITKETTYVVHNEEDTVLHDALFTKDVVTRLPYAISTRAGVSNYTGVMIDDERLIGISSANEAINRLDVFTF